MKWRPRFSLRTLVILPLLATSAAALWLHWKPWYFERELPRALMSFLSSDGRQVIGIGPIDELTVCRREGRQFHEIPGCVRLVDNDPYRLDPWRVIVRRDGLLAVVDVETGKKLVTLRTEKNDPLSKHVGLVTISPDRSRLLIAGGVNWQEEAESNATVWNARTGERLRVLDPEPWLKARDIPIPERPEGEPGMELFVDPILAFSYSPDGSQLLASAKSGRLWILDPGTCEPVGLLEAHVRPALIHFGPDGSRAVTIDGLVAIIWNTGDWSQLRRIEDIGTTIETFRILYGKPNVDSFSRAQFSADGKRIFLGHRFNGLGPTLIVDSSDGSTLLKIEDCENPLFTPDGMIADFGTRIVVRDPSNGEVIAEVTEALHSFTGLASGLNDGLFLFREDVLRSCFSPSGQSFVTSGLRLDDTTHSATGIYRRRRPEWRWGVFWMWEFWLTTAFAGLFVWSVVRDRRALGSKRPSRQEGL